MAYCRSYTSKRIRIPEHKVSMRHLYCVREFSSQCGRLVTADDAALLDLGFTEMYEGMFSLRHRTRKVRAALGGKKSDFAVANDYMGFFKVELVQHLVWHLRDVKRPMRLLIRNLAKKVGTSGKALDHESMAEKAPSRKGPVPTSAQKQEGVLYKAFVRAKLGNKREARMLDRLMDDTYEFALELRKVIRKVWREIESDRQDMQKLLKHLLILEYKLAIELRVIIRDRRRPLTLIADVIFHHAFDTGVLHEYYYRDN